MSELRFEKALEDARKYEKPFIPFKFKKLQNDDVLGSKILGVPYWEKNGEIPVNVNGIPLQMLAQINLATIQELPNFPKKGILQFFIDPSNESYGLNFDKPIDPQSNKVIYWADPSADQYSAYPYEKMDATPAFNPLEIIPQNRTMEICGVADEYYYDQQYPAELRENDDDEFWEFLLAAVDNSESKIGGYAYFTQSDPRSYSDEEFYNALDCKLEDKKEFVILLQLASDDAAEYLMWGDCGVANWHILEEDLKKLDFSRVFYNWDCF